MELRAQSPIVRALAIAGILLLATGLGYWCFRLAWADTLADTGELDKLERAVRLAPSQAEYHNRLGRALIYAVNVFEMDRATRELETATRLSPRTGHFWMDLGLAYEMQNRPAEAAAAMERAALLRPRGVDSLWTVANYFLRTHQIERSLPFFRELMALTPDYNNQTFAILWRASDNAEADVGRILPASIQAWAQYLQFLVGTGDLEVANRQWKKIQSRKESYDPRMVFSYVDLLLSKNQPEAAFAVWQHLRDTGQIPSAHVSQAAGNLLFNGDFEESPLLGGFDWRVAPFTDASVDLESPLAHTGNFSLKVEFLKKENFDFGVITHLVPVEPLHRYRLSGFLRAESLTSDSGPRLLVMDYYTPGKLRVTTPDVLGTTDWKEVSCEFTTPPDTRLLRVVLYRPPSRTFDNKISGGFWLDTVRLESIGLAPSGTGLGPVAPGRADSHERRKAS